MHCDTKVWLYRFPPPMDATVVHLYLYIRPLCIYICTFFFGCLPLPVTCVYQMGSLTGADDTCRA